MTSRRRQVPWIHRRSRLFIGAIALLGILNTGYITFTKLFGGETTCPTKGCELVLSSPYAEIFGFPLSLFGLIAYLGIAALALVPLALKSEKSEGKRAARSPIEDWSWLLLFIGTTAMLVFSGYLMYIMFTQFVAVHGVDGICYFCLASALFATAMFVLTLIGKDWDDRGQLLFTGVIVAMVTLVGTVGVYAANNPSAPGSGSDVAAQGFNIQSTSGEAEIALARHLKQVGAKMYGAYWCPHCHDQKELFGKEALADVPYIECARDAKNSQTAVCEAVAPKVAAATKQDFGFPTWEINGKFYVGTQTLEELATASNYTGPRNFKNSPGGV